MSSHHTEDYSNNIDDQLLSVAKQEGVVVDPQGHSHNDFEATRVKLEQIAHAAALSDRQQKQPQHQHQHLQASQVHGDPSQQALAHQHATGLDHHGDHQHAHHKDIAQRAYELLESHMHQYDDSEYNIQIPEPIIDAKTKIYPVSENTITAEGNLITRPFPEQVLHSRDELNDFIQEFARDNGFGVVIAHSNKKAIYYTCELGGRYRQKKSKKHMEDTRLVDIGNGYLLDPSTKTKKLRCPFAMTATFKKSTGMWTLKTTCNEHNHPQLDPLSNHPMLRKRSDELNLLILDLYKVGTKPSHIEAKIKDQYPDVLIKREDIYNEIRGYKRKLKKQSRYLSPGNAVQDSNIRHPFKKRTNANSFQEVDLHDDATNDQVLEYELQQQHQRQQEAELQRQLHQAATAAAAVHQPHHHLDELQLQQYQQLQDHNLQEDNGDNTDSNTAAAIAAVANAHHHHHHNENELSMDNIDSRLVGE